MNTSSVYKTQDIILAAALKCLKFKMDDVEITGNKGTFFFIDVPQQTVVDYDLGKLCVEPQTFNATIRQLTTMCRRMSDSKGYKDIR